jgi:hypothetical protein
MTAPIDIFAVEPEGVNWLGSAETLEDAKARVQELARRAPGEFVLLNQLTGKKLIVKTDGETRPLEGALGAADH